MKKYKTLQELFRSAKRWTKGASARAKDWKACLPVGPIATCFCITGGLKRIYSPCSDEYSQAYRKLTDTLNALYPDHKYEGLAGYNDDPRTTIDDIRRLVKKAGV